jgi:hypothetical protein
MGRRRYIGAVYIIDEDIERAWTMTLQLWADIFAREPDEALIPNRTIKWGGMNSIRGE